MVARQIANVGTAGYPDHTQHRSQTNLTSDLLNFWTSLCSKLFLAYAILLYKNHIKTKSQDRFSLWTDIPHSLVQGVRTFLRKFPLLKAENRQSGPQTAKLKLTPQTAGLSRTNRADLGLATALHSVAHCQHRAQTPAQIQLPDNEVLRGIEGVWLPVYNPLAEHHRHGRCCHQKTRTNTAAAKNHRWTNRADVPPADCPERKSFLHPTQPHSRSGKKNLSRKIRNTKWSKA